MDPLTGILFIIGLVALIVGAELLVRGAARLAVGFGISPLVVGLTVVAFDQLARVGGEHRRRALRSG